MADIAQVFTQRAGIRCLGVSMTLFSIDEEDGPQLFTVDPAGYYVGYFAVAIGQKEIEATNYLEKRLKENPSSKLSFEDTVQLSISTLQYVLNSEIKSSEIEVAVVNSEKTMMKILDEKEVDKYLKNISEKDN
jgi:20S proteasome subunit alpha 1